MTLAAALKFNRFERTKWKFPNARVYKTIQIRLLLKVCVVVFSQWLLYLLIFGQFESTTPKGLSDLCIRMLHVWNQRWLHLENMWPDTVTM